MQSLGEKSYYYTKKIKKFNFKSPHYFKKIRISALALVKMVTHAK